MAIAGPDDDEAVPGAPLTTASGAAPSVAELTRLVEEGLRYCHAQETQMQARVAELGAALQAMMQALLRSKVLKDEAYLAEHAVAEEMQALRLRTQLRVIVDDTPDKYAIADAVEIDCAARLPLCHARCCTLPFPLSVQDLDEGALRWEYRAPYRVRARADGYCVHNARPEGAQPGGACEVHGQRPASCRRYDCRGDERIWQDFDARIPARAPE